MYRTASLIIVIGVCAYSKPFGYPCPQLSSLHDPGYPVFGYRPAIYPKLFVDPRALPLANESSTAFFDKIKDDPEFQAIFQELEAKYLAEHERVRQWMKENDKYLAL